MPLPFKVIALAGALLAAVLFLPATFARSTAKAVPSYVLWRAPEATGVVDWMKNPPPAEVSSVMLKGKNEVVGVVLPAGIQPGEKVTGTVVVVPKDPKATAEATGVVEMETPDGKKHSVKNGSLVTFVAAAGTAIALLGKNGKAEAKADCPLAKAAAEAAKPKGPFMLQDNCATSLPIPSNGDARETICKIGGQPAQVVAARPGQAIVVPQNVSGMPGPVPIEAECNGEKAKLDGWAVNSTLTAPPRLKVGENGTAKLTIFMGAKPGADSKLTARITNNTPAIVSLGGKPTMTLPIDMAKVSSEGVYEVEVPFTALRPGTYSISSTVSSDRTSEGCLLSCTSCEGSHYLTYYKFCNDAGKVSCYSQGKACGGGCGGHRAVGGPCGFWLCACSWNKCHCK